MTDKTMDQVLAELKAEFVSNMMDAYHNGAFVDHSDAKGIFEAMFDDVEMSARDSDCLYNLKYLSEDIKGDWND